MAVGFQNRNPLGMSLQRSILPGDQPDFMPMPSGLGMSAPEQPKKQGWFAPGSKGQMIAGIIADGLRGALGQEAVFGPMMQQQRQQQAEEAQWGRRLEQQRTATREDKQWEWANKPQDLGAPYRWRANDGSLMEMGADGQPRVAYQDPTEKTSFITADNGDGTQTVIPVVNGVPQMGSKPQGSASPKRNLGPVVDTLPGGPQARPAGTFRP